jgi:AcrR family transcriptional regulator
LKTEEKIILRARMLFMKKGIGPTTMSEIALITGIHRRTLYRYFPSKEDLVCRMQIIITAQLNDYFNRIGKRLTRITGAELMEEYFRHIDLEKLKEFLFLNAQFDSHFSGIYPNKALKEEMENLQDPTRAILFNIILKGQQDGTLRNNQPAKEMYLFIHNTFLALLHRILLLESHQDKAGLPFVDYYALFVQMVLDSFSTR